VLGLSFAGVFLMLRFWRHSIKRTEHAAPSDSAA
jgi:MATE family multidrug resistance protein